MKNLIHFIILCLLFSAVPVVSEDLCPEEEFKEAMVLAKQGDADTQFFVGFSLIADKGIPENKEEAFKWFKKSAEQGNTKAQIVVGAWYYDKEMYHDALADTIVVQAVA